MTRLLWTPFDAEQHTSTIDCGPRCRCDHDSVSARPGRRGESPRLRKINPFAPHARLNEGRWNTIRLKEDKHDANDPRGRWRETAAVEDIRCSSERCGY